MQFATVVLTLWFLAQAAAAADVAPEKVDQIFAGYNKAGSPGMLTRRHTERRFCLPQSLRLRKP